MGGITTARIVALALGTLAGLHGSYTWAQSRPTSATAQPQVVSANPVEAEISPSELEVYLASANLAMQPPATVPSLATPRSAAASRSARPPMNRLASAPEMFGDFFQSGGDFNFGPNRLADQGLPPNTGSFSVPPPGGGRRVKISENNKALPDDRLIFSYNHFENALQFTEMELNNPGSAVTQTFPIDRYTIGIEKTFLDGFWSCEVRMPFQGAFDFEGTNIRGTGGQVGNLAVIAKHLLYQDEELATVIGLGIDIPTGSDFEIIDGSALPFFPATQVTFHNDALHLLPYAGFLFGGDRPYFVNGFLQVDIATEGNRLEAGPVGGPSRILGRFNEQNLLFVDLGTGYWLYRDEFNDGGLTNLAAILEFHYTSSLQDTDVIQGNIGGRPFNYTNNFNRFDIVNVTAGFQAQFNNRTSLRVAGVFPLGEADDERFFDSEVQVQVNRRY